MATGPATGRNPSMPVLSPQKQDRLRDPASPRGQDLTDRVHKEPLPVNMSLKDRPTLETYLEDRYFAEERRYPERSFKDRESRTSLGGIDLGIGELKYQQHMYPNDDLRPCDSVSQYGDSYVSSRTSSLASEKARVIQREIEIQSKVAILEKKQMIAKRQVELERLIEKEEYEVRIRRRDIEASKAELAFQQQQLILREELKAAKAMSEV